MSCIILVPINVFLGSLKCTQDTFSSSYSTIQSKLSSQHTRCLHTFPISCIVRFDTVFPPSSCTSYPPKNLRLTTHFYITSCRTLRSAAIIQPPRPRQCQGWVTESNEQRGIQRRGESARRKRQKTIAASTWPRNYTGKRFPTTSLLHNLDDTLWYGLAHVFPTLFDKSKGKEEQDVALCMTLRKIGVGWVATNNTYIRQVRSGFYHAAQSFYSQNGWKHPMSPFLNAKHVHVEDLEFVGSHGREYASMG